MKGNSKTTQIGLVLSVDLTYGSLSISLPLYLSSVFTVGICSRCVINIGWTCFLSPEYGCCKDNSMPALGENYQGCPGKYLPPRRARVACSKTKWLLGRKEVRCTIACSCFSGSYVIA